MPCRDIPSPGTCLPDSRPPAVVSFKTDLSRNYKQSKRSRSERRRCPGLQGLTGSITEARGLDCVMWPWRIPESLVRASQWRIAETTEHLHKTALDPGYPARPI